MSDNMESKEGSTYHAREICISFEIRILSITMAFAATCVTKYIFNVYITPQILAVFSIWVLVCAFYLLLIKKLGTAGTRRVIDNVHFTYYFPGVACATVLVHYLGGVEWVAFLLYVFDIVYGNVMLTRLKGALVTALIVASFFTLGLLEYGGVIPHERFLASAFADYRNLRYFLTMTVIVGGGLFFVLSFLTGLFSKIKEDREKNILDSKKRFETKSRHLEKMTRVLRKKVAENRYIKSTARGYIEKKESELEVAKKDLETQIEKLRKTQRSMFFMIEDLNDMSGHLKEARDHLEEKVKERTDELLTISKKLHRSERLAFLGKLAGSVTHELRNPLAVLKNAAYYLEKKLEGLGDEKSLKYIETMKKEVSTIDSIIDDVMGFAKTRPPKFKVIDIEEVIDDSLSMINVPELIEVKKEFREAPKIEVDTSQLVHAIVNIANNAIIAMKGNGALTFKAYAEGDHATIEIEDTGPGIPVEQRDLIFEPLYSSRPKGTGLGLPIAKMMVENQKGNIDFISEVGKGTVFRIRLPLRINRRGKHE